MKLYYAPGTIAVASAITLFEAGLPFDPVRVDFASAEQTGPDYARINPKARVPALVTADGILTENGAIQEYAAACAPAAGLVPDDPFQAGKMREAMFYLASTAHVAHAHKMRGHRWATQESSWEDMAAKVTENMAECCDYIENNVLEGPYVLGEVFSLADAYLFVVCTWLKGDGVDIATYPKLQAFFDLMNDRPSVQRAREDGFLPRRKT